jgi:class 3 adenylate cyclase
MIAFLSAFGQIATPDFMDPKRHGLDADLVHEAGVIHRTSSPREVQVALLRAFFDADVTDLVGQLDLPVLVMHGSRDVRVPLDKSRELAARVKDVKFVPYNGAGSAPWADRDVLLPEIFRFLGVEPPELAPLRATATARPHDDHAAVHTILFTDIADSTGLTQRLGDAKAQELVRAHNAIVREALSAHGGTEIKHTGDGIMASFPTASGALECAVAIQRAVAEHGDANLQVHIGLNAGEPVAEERDLFGTSVQLARRICDQAESGEILVPEAVRHLLAGKNFLFADRGEVGLKGFEEPVRLYEVRWREA